MMNKDDQIKYLLESVQSLSLILSSLQDQVQEIQLEIDQLRENRDER